MPRPQTRTGPPPNPSAGGEPCKTCIASSFLPYTPIAACNRPKLSSNRTLYAMTDGGSSIHPVYHTYSTRPSTPVVSPPLQPSFRTRHLAGA